MKAPRKQCSHVEPNGRRCLSPVWKSKMAPGATAGEHYCIRHDIAVTLALAAKLANMKRGGDRKSENQSLNLDFDLTIEQAAQLFSVSRATVAEVKAIEKEAPELIEQIEQGKITVNQAKKKAGKKKRQKERAKIAKKAAKIKPSDRWHIYHADMQP